MGTAKLPRIFTFCMGSHMLPIEQGRHLRLPRHRGVCKLCRTGALGDKTHLLLECLALADVRIQFSQLIADCSGIMARLVKFRDQPLVSRYIIACLDMVLDHRDTDATPSIQLGWLPRMSKFPSFPSFVGCQG